MLQKKKAGGGNPLVDILASTAGLSAAKFGSDDKHQGYILKQNSFLKCVLFALLASGLGVMVLLSTTYELKIAKRGLVLSETYHLKREKHDHKHLMNIALDLQQSLEHNLQSSELVEEFRAVFGKLVGNNENRVHALLLAPAPASADNLAELKQTYLDFNIQVDAYLTRVIQTLQGNNRQAKDKIKRLSQLIVSEIDSEARQEKRYASKMEKMDVDDAYVKQLEKEEREEAGEGEDEEEEEAFDAEEDEEDEENDRELAKHMDNFFAQLKQLPTYSLDPAVLTQMEQAIEDFDAVLDDDSKDADVDLFEKKMFKLSGRRPASAEGKDSAVQFYRELLETAKIAPYKQNLFDLYNGWKAPDSQITVREVLAEVQNVAQKGELMKLFDFMDDAEGEEGEGEEEGEPAAAAAEAST